MDRSSTVHGSRSAVRTSPSQRPAAAPLEGTQLHVLAWGDDGAGQCLGGARSSAASFVPRPSIVRIPAGHNQFTQIGAGWEQSFLISGAGSLWAGGSNRNGCISGDGIEQVLGVRPVDREDAEDLKASAVVAGREHFVAIDQDGASLSTWGCSNEFGQTGQGNDRVSTGACSLRTFAVQPGVKIHAVACGQDHVLALTERGEVFAWGDNMSGQLGRSAKTTTPSLATPQHVEAGALRGLPVRQIAAGAHHSLVLGISGQVVSWGTNRFGRLGLGAAFDELDIVSLPTLAAGLARGVRSVAGGGRHSAVVLRKGVLMLAGDNRAGQLGQDPDVVPYSGTFVEVQHGDFLRRVRAVALGEAHSLLLTYEGELYGMGATDRGQLGEPIGGCVHVPRLVEMPNPQLIIWSVAAGPGHSLVLASEPPETLARTRSKDLEAVGVSAARTLPLSVAMLARAGSVPDGRFALTMTAGMAAPPSPDGAMESDEEGGLIRSVAYHGRGGPVRTVDEESPELFERLRSVGCGSKTANSGKLVIPVEAVEANAPGARHQNGAVLLRPVVRPGVANGVGFLSFTVDELSRIVQDLPEALPDSGPPSAAQELLRTTVGAVLRCPTVLGSCFLFPALNESRLNAGGLCQQILDMRRRSGSNLVIDEHWAAATMQGIAAFAPAGGLLRNVRSRDQVRVLVLWLLVPNWSALLASYTENGARIAPHAFEAATELLNTIARLPAEGRVAFRDIIAEECDTLFVLRDVLLVAARALANAAVRHCVNLTKVAKPMWEAVLLLQLISAADIRRMEVAASAAHAAREADALAVSLAPGIIGRSLSKTSGATAEASPLLAGTTAPAVGVALPKGSFEISALIDLKFPPHLELQMFAQHSEMKLVDPVKVCEEAAWEIDPKTGNLPVAFQSFMANGNLVPVPFKQSIVQVENVMRQQAEQHRQILSGGVLHLLPWGALHVPAEAAFLLLTVHRDRIVADTASLLRKASAEDLKRPLKVKFADEDGVDEGGVAKEFFRLLAEQLFNPAYGMFTVDAESRYLWFNPSTFNDMEDFELVGSVVGLAVYNNLPGLDLNFPLALFKKLNGMPTTVEDLAAVFPAHALSLQAVLKWQPPPGTSPEEADSLFQDTFCLDFSVSYDACGELRTASLLEGDGPPPAVTLSRRAEFAELFREWYLTKSVAGPFDAFQRGFDRVCTSRVWRCLTAQELEAIVCGEKDLDFSRLRKGSIVVDATVGFRPGYVDEFWAVLMSFDILQKRQFLKFVTGSDLAPVGGLERLAMKIQRNGGEPTSKLPTSQTCFNLLLLPEYSDVAKLQRLLTTAIENAEGFGLQ